MASKTTTPKQAAARRVAAKTTARTQRTKAAPAHKGDPAKDVDPFVGSPAATAVNAAAATAAQRAEGDPAFAANVQGRLGDIQSAVAQRAADVKDMEAENEKAQRDAAVQHEETVAEARKLQEVARVPTNQPVVQPVGPGPAPVLTRTPGTGVADPRDLAPGQDLSPCPAGGLTVTPLPNKPGSLYSAL